MRNDKSTGLKICSFFFVLVLFFICIHGLNSHLQLTEKRQENQEDDLDSRALEEGFVSDNFVFWMMHWWELNILLHYYMLICSIWNDKQVTVTPLSVYENGDMEIQSSVSSWLAIGVSGDGVN